MSTSRIHFTFAGHLRWVAAAGLTAALAATSGPALAQPAGPPMAADCSTLHFNLSNPTAGDTLLSGGYIVQGFAFDAAATTQQGTGVDRVDFFLDDRDAGGLNLGTADLGQPSVVAMPGTQFGMAGFSLDVALPAQSGGHTLFAYAHSTVTGQEQMLSVPIQVGEESDAEAVPGGAVATTGTPTCAAPSPTQAPIATGTAPSQATPQPAATPAAIPATAPAAAVAPAPMAATLHLMLANPQSGDNLLAGAYSIAGTAFDSSASQGSGVDRVEIFLGDRDQGGLLLGQTAVQASSAGLVPLGSFSIEVDLPDQDAGSTLFAYARSSVTGEEMVVAIPVIVGTIAD